MSALIAVEVVACTDLAPDIKGFTLARPDGQPLPAFDAGAHIDVHLGNGLARPYSLCNFGDGSGRYEVAVLREPASRGGSSHLHDQVRPGHRLTIGAPRNAFVLDETAPAALLFAGGIGITPLLSMAARLWQVGTPFALHYSARSAARAAFIERLRTAPFAASVVTHFDDVGPVDAAAVMAGARPGSHLYVCGPSGYMAFILATARAQGWAEARLHREYFEARSGARTGDEAFQIRIQGRLLDVPAGVRALDVLLDHGYDVPVSCEQGICGTCLTRVVEGLPDHRDRYLTEAERAANDCFTPCCSRALTPLLVLDL